MRAVRAIVVGMVVAAAVVVPLQGQTRRSTPARRAAPAPPAPPIVEAPKMVCPAPLGTGVSTKKIFCDVLAGRDPAAGVVITIPPHRGDVTLTFDLYNRHTFSEEQMKEPKTAFAHYTAGIGVLTADNTLISRAAVDSEFRRAEDLFDRIGGGAGPRGVKAVAPVGVEHIRVTIPASENQVSLLGEKLVVQRADGTATYTSPGRPVAIVSDVMIEYRPAPAAPPPASSTRPRPRR